MYTKSFNIQFAGKLDHKEIQELTQRICKVPNTYMRWEENELFVVHFPFSQGRMTQDARTEKQWDNLTEELLYSENDNIVAGGRYSEDLELIS